MADPKDIIDFSWLPKPRSPHSKNIQPPSRRFLSIWFRCCHTYGRLYRNKTETAYQGHCPRCGASVRATIGSHGTARRIFEAR